MNKTSNHTTKIEDEAYNPLVHFVSTLFRHSFSQPYKQNLILLHIPGHFQE